MFTLAQPTKARHGTQILPALDKKKVVADSVSLVEVGPRCCLNPIRVFAGSFGGPVIYENTFYVRPQSPLLPCL